jgi:hypothetical protein
MPRTNGSKNEHSLSDIVQQNISLKKEIAELKASQADLKTQQAVEFARLHAQGEALAKFLLGKGPQP